MLTKIPHIIHVDLQSHAKRQIVYMKQGDEMSRELLIFFYNGGSAWAVPSEITSVSLSYCKADKVHGCYDHIADEVAYVFNSGRTSVTMAIHPQVLTAAGNVICELKLCNASGHALNTFNFVINCEQSPHAMGQKSEGYWNNVFDGATFTPHVSDAGILSWTNNKNLPNPDPIDLKEFVVDPGDMPVTTMEIVTSEDAAENAEADNKLITPAGAVVLIKNNVFQIRINETASPISIDKTAPEIYAAVAAGKNIKLRLSDGRELMPSTNKSISSGANTFRQLAFFDVATSANYTITIKTNVNPPAFTNSNKPVIKSGNSPALFNSVSVGGRSFSTVEEAIVALAEAINDSQGGAS